MSSAVLRGTLVINDVNYAELSIRYARIEDLDAMLQAGGIGQLAMPRAALFLAGKAFARYRARGGTRTGVLPDFFVGAHAAVLGANLLTRDGSRYRICLPSTTLVAPDQSFSG